MANIRKTRRLVMEKMTRKEKGIYLLKKYGYLMVFGICALVLVVALIATSGKKTTTPPISDVNNEVKEPVSSDPITFGLPIANVNIVKAFSNTKLQFNETLKQYEAHLATDFACEPNTSVCSIGAGTVIEVGNTYLKGNYVVIQHGDSLKSVYASLGDDIAVKVGQNVEKGTVIGVAGNTAHGELNTGDHLHFEMLDNDKKIDPSGYLTLENK